MLFLRGCHNTPPQIIYLSEISVSKLITYLTVVTNRDFEQDYDSLEFPPGESDKVYSDRHPSCNNNLVFPKLASISWAHPHTCRIYHLSMCPNAIRANKLHSLQKVPI